MACTTNTEQGKQRKSVEKSEVTQDSEVTPFYLRYILYVYVYIPFIYMYIYFIYMYIYILYVYVYQLIPLYSCDYLNKNSMKTNVATDEGNSRNEM